MDSEISITPDLTQDDITKKLFNSKHLSDVSFLLDDKTIHAHSFELMKQSRVFQCQLEPTMGDKKLIPIMDYKYDSFYQFIRFIYTDQCDMEGGIEVELLKLAVHYKVVRLENRLLDYISGDMNLRLFEFCVVNNYLLAKRRTRDVLARTLYSRFDSDVFRTLHPDAVEEILKFDPVDIGDKEEAIFEATARWIETYCKKHEIKLSEGRQQFDKLIRLIRFPTIRPEYIREIKIKYPDLLTKSDYMTICSQVMMGTDSEDEQIWCPTPRTAIATLYDYREFAGAERFETKFSVAHDSFLNGIRFNVEQNKGTKAVTIEITSRNNQTKESKTVKIVQELSTKWMSVITSFGESVRLQPNFLYTIAFDYMSTGGCIKLLGRERNQTIIVSEPFKSVRLIQEGANMSEMFINQI